VSTPAENSSPGLRRGRLLRILGVGFGIAVGVGATVGGGILRTPGEVAGYMGSAGLTSAIWLVGGVYTLLCSSCMSELAATLPRAGGWYVYSERAFGKRLGFVVGCFDWMNQTVGIAFLAVALGEFAAELHPALSSHATSVAVTGLSTLALLNLVGLRSGSRTQTLTSLLKALALIALVIGCFLVTGRAHTSAVAHLPTGAPAVAEVLLGWLLAFQAVVITYDAWYTPIYFAEEDRNPTRNVPRSLLATVVACTAIYLLINGALIHVLGMERLQVAKVPAAEASLMVFGGYGKQIMLLISIITVISALNASLLTAPRVLYAMARDRLLLGRLTSVNRGGTPAWGLLLSLVVAMALTLSGTFETLIAIGSVLIVAIYASGFASLLTLRRREPNLPRPYRTWWYPWSAIFALVVSLGFLFGAVIGDLRHSAFMVILAVLSYLASGMIVRRSANVSAPVAEPASPGLS
jgi:basic amino acid/polyamine antiporter, APA family